MSDQASICCIVYCLGGLIEPMLEHYRLDLHVCLLSATRKSKHRYAAGPESSKNRIPKRKSLCTALRRGIPAAVPLQAVETVDGDPSRRGEMTCTADSMLS